jgi:MoxR-like ATPase
VNAETFAQNFFAIETEVNKVLVGQESTVQQVLIALVARGHVLLEGVPGVGKTLLVRALSKVFGADFKRIQFTPDLMPTDITGGNVYDAQRGQFNFLAGPIFTQLLLADEVNRAPAKTQSALLEAMQDGTVTADGISRALPSPFLVVATQNPVESHGTYPLPEAQLDRFLLKILVSHPTREAELRILQNFVDGFDASLQANSELREVLSVDRMLEMQKFLESVRVETAILSYITDIVARTRTHSAIYLGSSPRGALGLVSTARAHAASCGRDFVTPDDVKMFMLPVLRHRLMMQPDAELANIGADDCLRRIVDEVPVPRGIG